MKTNKQKEIEEFLEKIGLEYSSVTYCTPMVLEVRSLFQTIAFVEQRADIKKPLLFAIDELIELLEDYKKKINEN